MKDMTASEVDQTLRTLPNELVGAPTVVGTWNFHCFKTLALFAERIATASTKTATAL